MRILFCVNSLGAVGGIERVTIVKANALADIPGNDVAICYTDKGTFPETVHPVSDKVKTYDLETPYWNLTSLPRVLKDFIPLVFKTRKAIKKVIKVFNPDVVVTTGSYEKYALAMVAKADRKGGG